MKVKTAFLLVILAMTACQPSEAGIQTAIVQTKAAEETAITQTKEAQKTPLADIILDSILFQSGDLPSQYSSGQIAYQWADELPQAFPPENVIIQKVGWDIGQGFAEEYLMIALYESTDKLEKSYQDIVSNFPDKPTESAQAGEKASFIFISTFSGRGFITFTRCNALVAIDITGADVSKDLMQAFAQRIDKRLKPLVCDG